MKRKFAVINSQTKWERIEKMNDNEIDLSDIPEITEEQLSQAKLRISGKLIQSSNSKLDSH